MVTMLDRWEYPPVSLTIQLFRHLGNQCPADLMSSVSHTEASESESLGANRILYDRLPHNCSPMLSLIPDYCPCPVSLVSII